MGGDAIRNDIVPLGSAAEALRPVLNALAHAPPAQPPAVQRCEVTCPRGPRSTRKNNDPIRESAASRRQAAGLLR